ILSVLVAATVLPLQAQGGNGGHAGGHGFNCPPRFRGGHPLRPQPFFDWGTGIDSTKPEESLVGAQFAKTSTIVASTPGPEFVFPPAPSSPSPAGSHTVIVQRGSQIEVQSFPAAR